MLDDRSKFADYYETRISSKLKNWIDADNTVLVTREDTEKNSVFSSYAYPKTFH